MEKQLKEMISKELEQFHCSILLDDVKEKVRKLKAYGIKETEIESIIHDKELFPQLIITHDYEIILSGEKKENVKMEPLVKAVYLLFLLHPEGIILKFLPDYQKELKSIYLLLRPKGITKKVEKSIEDVTNSTLNSINEKCARIRKIFSDILPANIARYYYISGKRGEAKAILLPRANVKWDCSLPKSQTL